MTGGHVGGKGRGHLERGGVGGRGGYLSGRVDVEERLVPNAEGLLGFVDLPVPHLLLPGEDDLLLDAQQSDVKIALAHGLTLKNKPRRQLENTYPINRNQKVSGPLAKFGHFGAITALDPANADNVPAAGHNTAATKKQHKKTWPSLNQCRWDPTIKPPLWALFPQETPFCYFSLRGGALPRQPRDRATVRACLQTCVPVVLHFKRGAARLLKAAQVMGILPPSHHLPPFQRYMLGVSLHSNRSLLIPGPPVCLTTLLRDASLQLADWRCN